MNQRGFSLIEVMVAIVLLAIVLLGLAPITLSMARQTRLSTTITQRTAVLSGEVDRLTAVDFSALPAVGTACTTFSSAGFPHTKCITVSDVNAKTKQVVVIVTPSNGAAADTTIFQRSKGSGNNPLYSP
jgi:prepilin-type N-terminal cleavage/methylation domain-containing protein